MASKMPDDGEKDDLDLERLTDESIESLRSIQPDEAMEQEEKEAAARRLVRYLEQSEDSATRLLYRRYIEGASYEKMAEEEHTTCSNMRRRVSRALASVRQTLIHVYQGGRFGICEEEIQEVSVEFMVLRRWVRSRLETSGGIGRDRRGRARGKRLG